MKRKYKLKDGEGKNFTVGYAKFKGFEKNEPLNKLNYFI